MIVNMLQMVYCDFSLIFVLIIVNVGKYVGFLFIFLVSIVKLVGYEVVFNFNIDVLVFINGEIVFGNSIVLVMIFYVIFLGRFQELLVKFVVYNFLNVFFNEVWFLFMDVYELDY